MKEKLIFGMKKASWWMLNAVSIVVRILMLCIGFLFFSIGAIFGLIAEWIHDGTEALKPQSDGTSGTATVPEEEREAD